MPEVRLQELIVKLLERIEQQVASIDAFLRDANPPDPRRLYSRKEAAHILNVSTRTIDGGIRASEIEVVRKARSIHVVGDSIGPDKLADGGSAVELIQLWSSTKPLTSR